MGAVQYKVTPLQDRNDIQDRFVSMENKQPRRNSCRHSSLTNDVKLSSETVTDNFALFMYQHSKIAKYLINVQDVGLRQKHSHRYSMWASFGFHMMSTQPIRQFTFLEVTVFNSLIYSSLHEKDFYYIIYYLSTLLPYLDLINCVNVLCISYALLHFIKA